jgi:hypothetical protein
MVMVPTSPRQLPSQQQQMLVVASQQQSQVQGQLSPSNRQTGGNNSLFDALDQNRDGVITRSEFNRAFGVSPLLMGSAATTPVVSAVITSSPRALVGSPSMTLATPGAQPGTGDVMSPSRRLSQSASSVQAVMGSPILMAVPASPLPGAQVDREPVMATPLVEIRP